MNQFFAAGAALLITITLLGFGRKPKRLLATKFSGYRYVNHMSLVYRSEPAHIEKIKMHSDFFDFQPPKTAKEKSNLRKYMKGLICSGSEERLLAMEIADKWRDLSVLPILKLGLRDVDSRVVAKAASAIARFKGHSQNTKNIKLVRHPLNVSRMR
ncbi:MULTISPECIES: hypothetical protein [Prochlorococcus]|uniref:HEAT repeat domain-containing protein n=1 Tax=Prochlorococcus marinus (strain SARG / CCMP1375 / SS120) TaxID=167539 RepID=Q7V9Z4_PROMA|nr:MULTISPECIES: hypothetical protein [Prochlorococcus]AAQ00721.1 Predicted protein [Prochlorococcus marinus subsp. marinus str. CCMP1375]KGG10782.1 putative Annexin [Prochlorococcus marinus str. LG]KGG20130.1 putative Annexin [Prochlorococcus marinus str. SS2]KGG24029.1 putative Annexin [Prochlorococcus marinus str. SS35]KGG31711.1 putative Annexin [Prochlorococcus marinus str. SS51]